jgi:protoporphyrinogen IX oxidase
VIVWLKFVHVAAIAIWCAGLICLPGLYVQRAHVRDEQALYRLQGLVRFSYVSLISPAAFVAVASGTALIFVAGTFVPWFSLKLAFVGALVVIHLLTGLVIIRLFEEGQIYPAWRFVAVTCVTVFVTIAILVIVLAKPRLGFDDWPDLLTTPGALGELLGGFIPWAR